MTFEDILAETGHLIWTNVGDSMMPLLRERQDLLVIGPKPKGRLRLWDVPLYRRPNTGKCIMHRVICVLPHSYVMLGDNQWRPEFGVRDDQIIGILEGVTRRDDDTSHSSQHYLPVRSTPEHPHVPFRYRAYVMLWALTYPFRAPYILVRNKIRLYRYRNLINQR